MNLWLLGLFSAEDIIYPFLSNWEMFSYFATMMKREQTYYVVYCCLMIK